LDPVLVGAKATLMVQRWPVDIVGGQSLVWV
jgi:hypothetical protein